MAMADQNSIDYTMRVRAESQAGTQQFANDMGTASNAARSVGDALAFQKSWFSQTSAEVNKNTQATQANVNSQQQLEQAIERLAGQLDPVVAKTNQYVQQMDLLKRALDANVISQQTFNNLSNQAEAALDKASGAVNGLALSSGFALREVHAMMDELASGRVRQFEGTLANVAGQLIQTAGFAGIATVGFVALTAAVAGLIISTASYESEVREVNTALTVHNSTMGITGGQAVLLAQDISTVSTVSAQAALDIIKMSASLNVTTEQMAKIAEISKPFSDAIGGKNAEDGAKAINQYLNEDSVKALTDINAAFHNVTQADIEYAQSLKAAGDVAGQHTLILQKLNSVAQEQEAGAGGMAKAWDQMKQSLSDNYDQLRRYLASLAGTPSLADQVATAHQNLINYQGQENDAIAAGDDAYLSYTITVAKLRDEYDGLNAKLQQTPEALAAVALAATQAGDQLVIAGQKVANALNPNNARANLLKGQISAMGYGVDGRPGANMNDAFTVDEWKNTIGAIGGAQSQLSLITGDDGGTLTPGQIALNQSRRRAAINGIKDPQKRAQMMAQDSARQQGMSLGLSGGDLDEYINNMGTSAYEKHAPRAKGRNQRDLTKAANQKNTDQLSLASAYDSGDADSIQKQIALNQALEQSVYNTGTSIDKLKQAVLDEKAAMAAAAAAQTEYNEKLKLTAQQALTSGYASGGVAGMNAASRQNDANTQFDSKIAAARASGNQVLTQKIQLEKQNYLATEQSIDASKQQLQLLQTESANKDTIQTLQTQIAAIGKTTLEQNDLNGAVRIYQQLVAKGYDMSTASSQQAYKDLVQQNNEINQLNENLKEAQQKQADYKDEVNQLGDALGDAFYNGIIAGNSLKDTFASLLETVAKMIFQMEVLKPLMESINNSSSGSGGFFASLLGLGKGAGAAAGAGAGGAATAVGGFDSAVMFAHTGGIAGSFGQGTRTASSSLWGGAQRYHSGGIVDGEVPIIAQQGEAVMPTVRMSDGTLGIKAAGGGGGGSATIHAPVNVTIQYNGSGGMKDNDMSDMGSKLSDHLESVLNQRMSEWARNQTRPGGLLSGSRSNVMGA